MATKKSSIQGIVDSLMKAKEVYYEGKRPIFSDAEFDSLEDSLRELDPTNSYFDVVGAKLENVKEKYTHSIPMLSCAKAKTMEEVEKWMNKFGVKEVIVQSKIDGLSADLGYENGKLVSAATRGDGSQGQLVTKLMDYVNIPKTIKLLGKVHIRGEFVIFKDSTIENPDNTNLRNICAGIINRKTIIPAQLAHIHFVGYQIYGSTMNTEADKIAWLKANKFDTIEPVVLNTVAEIEKYYNDYMAQYRNDWDFATDGLVLVVNDSTLHDKIDKMGSVDHHHLYAIAIKPTNESAETSLEKIEWNVSRQGKLIPIAIFKPVVIDGATITRASLTCYENVLRMKMAVGDKLEIVKAGAIIPYVEKNITKGISQR